MKLKTQAIIIANIDKIPILEHGFLTVMQS